MSLKEKLLEVSSIDAAVEVECDAVGNAAVSSLAKIGDLKTKELAISDETTKAKTPKVKPKRRRVMNIYYSMIQRCTNPNHPYWDRYGGRGIEVCERWSQDPKNFIEDMGEPGEDQSLDRIDPDGPYEKENCRWATPKQQARNRSSNKVIEFKDVKLPLSHWADLFGINPATLSARLKNGTPFGEALRRPVGAKLTTSSTVSVPNHGESVWPGDQDSRRQWERSFIARAKDGERRVGFLIRRLTDKIGALKRDLEKYDFGVGDAITPSAARWSELVDDLQRARHIKAERKDDFPADIALGKSLRRHGY